MAKTVVDITIIYVLDRTNENSLNSTHLVFFFKFKIAELIGSGHLFSKLKCLKKRILDSVLYTYDIETNRVR